MHPYGACGCPHYVYQELSWYGFIRIFVKFKGNIPFDLCNFVTFFITNHLDIDTFMADNLRQIKTALISVFHKDGLDEILALLHKRTAWKFPFSTGGTESFYKIA